MSITKDQLKKGVAYMATRANNYVERGDIIYLIEDDETVIPWFSKDKNVSMNSISVFAYPINNLELAEPEKKCAIQEIYWDNRPDEEIVAERNDLLARANKLTGIIKKRKNEADIIEVNGKKYKLIK